MVYNVDTLNMVDIGWTGENNATVISIDVKSWLGKWPDAQISLVVCRPKEDVFYPVIIEQKNHFAIWRVTLADVSIPGMGNAVLYAKSRNEDVIAKHPFRLRVNAALDSALKDPPEVGREWLEQVLDAADRAEAAQASYYTPKMDGFELVWEPSWEGLPALPKTNIRGEKGETGLGIESLEQVRYTTADEGINTWKATLTDGTYSLFNVHNGSKGSQGERGERGEPGKDGYTPIKGVDYFDGAPGTPGKDGAPGAPGSSGVYIGKEAPTDANVWIDPEGKGTETLPNPHPLVINGVRYDGSEKVEFDAVPYGKYELIETIVVDEDMVIERTEEPNGTPYNFTAVAMRIKKNAGVSYPSTFTVQAYFNLSGSRNQPLYVPSSTKTTEELWCYAEVKQYKGLWERERAAEWSVKNFTATPMLVKVPMFDNAIRNNETIVCLKSTSAALAGTTIEIWGVRA